jgi:hypothetical protein
MTVAPEQQQAPHPFDLPMTDFERLLERDFRVQDIEDAQIEAIHAQDKDHFMRAVYLARAVDRLRELIRPLMDLVVIPLMNTRMGFKTDRPSSRNPNTYSQDEVLEAVLEAITRGANLTGNEFNIIGGNCYLTKEFFERKLREHPDLTDLVPLPGVPRIQGESALLPYTVKYKFKGQAFEVTREVPIRVNAMMGVDAVIGKADRKMFAQVWRIITGSKMSFPDGDVSDLEVTNYSAPGVAVTRNSRLADVQTGVVPTNGHSHTPAPPPAPTQAAPAAPAPQAAPAAAAAPASPPPSQPAPAPQQQAAPADTAPRRSAGRPRSTTTTSEPSAPAAEHPAPTDPREDAVIAQEYVDANSPDQLKTWILREKAARPKIVDAAMTTAQVQSLVDADNDTIRNVAFNLKIGLLELERRRKS